MEKVEFCFVCFSVFCLLLSSLAVGPLKIKLTTSEDQSGSLPHAIIYPTEGVKSFGEEEWIQMKDDMNTQRRRILQAICQKYQDQFAKTSIELKTFFVSHSRKLAACRVPKDASTSLKVIFSKLDGDGGFTRLKSSQVNDNYTLFVMVREPFERLASAYVDKFVKHQGSKGFSSKLQLLLERAHHKNTSNSPVAFSKFIKNIVLGENDGMGMDAHWTPAWKICNICSHNYDYLLHLEPPFEDFKYLFTKLGLDPQPLMIWNHVSLSNNASSMSEVIEEKHKKLATYLQQLDRPTLMRVYQKFRMDYELFGYDFNNVLQMADCDPLTKEDEHLPS